MPDPETLNVPSHIGDHLVEQEGDDLLIVEQEGDDLLIFRLRNDLRAQEAREFVRRDRALARRNGYSHILMDCKELRSFGSQARHAAFDEMKRDSGYIGTTAVFAASSTIPWIMRLMFRALGVLISHIDDETQLFTTEAQARAFIDKRRPQRQREGRERRLAG